MLFLSSDIFGGKSRKLGEFLRLSETIEAGSSFTTARRPRLDGPGLAARQS